MAKNGNNKGLDELSWNILKELQSNARMSTTEIGRRIGLSAPAVSERIAKLEENGVIKGYHTAMEFDKLGLTIRAFIAFKTSRLKHAELIRLVEAIPELTEWYAVTGNHSILLKIAAASSERLAGIIEHLEEYGETSTSLILSEGNKPRFGV